MRLGGEIYDHVGLPSLERFTDCRLIGDIGMNERVPSIAGDVAQVQMTARVGKLVDYHYAPVSLAERKTDEVRPMNPAPPVTMIVCILRQFWEIAPPS